jgi:hypothetical protein
MSSNNSPTGNNAPRPDNPNVAAPPPVPALPGPAADDADDGLIVANPIDTFGRPFLATVPVDEASLLEHRSKLLTFGEKYAESMEKLQSDLIDETDFLYVLRKNAYEKCVEQISNLEKRIDETKALINKSVAAENENNESGDDAGSVSSGESQNPLSGITPRNVFSPPVSPQPSNDGSRMLDDNEIPNADEFD